MHLWECVKGEEGREGGGKAPVCRLQFAGSNCNPRMLKAGSMAEGCR